MPERIQIVELDLDRCSLTYGEAPCTASVPTTGEQKCFNCLASCQDRTNYASETVTVRYSSATGNMMPQEIELIPNLESVGQRPAKLELGESIGIRANIDLSFSDSRSPDTGPDGDYYLAERNYDPYKQGSYWGKFRARYPYLKGSDIRLLQGTTDQTLEQMEVRHFIVDKVAGPDSGGRFVIQCKDALQLANGKQAQAPRISNGLLAIDITSGATSVTLLPNGIGAEYPASGTAQIGGKEVVTFTRSGDTFTITRAQNNTEAVDHKQDDRFQLCLVYAGQRSVNIIQDLLENYANVPTSYIPFGDWTSEWQNYIDRLYSAVIAEPTPVDDLINELLQQTASTLWWDDSTRLLRFRVLREVSSTAALYNDDLIKAGTFSVKDQPEKRVSQVWTYYGQLNPLEKLDETSNYTNSLATVASESESDYGSPSIKRIYSRWIASNSRDAASRLNDLILSRYTTPPRLFTWGLQRSDLLIQPSLGGGYRLENRSVQSFDGSTDVRPIQVIQVKTTESGHSVLAEEVLYNQTIAPVDPTTKPVYVDTDEINYNLYEATTAQYEVNTGDTINCEVAQGIIIGSSSVSLPAFTTGSGWPAGVTINIINRGTIVGRGGDGGRGGAVQRAGEVIRLAGNGFSGGDCLDFTVDANITNEGIIGGGGGGGAGSIGDIESKTITGVGTIVIGLSGNGGGAGAGTIPSSGGQSGEVIGLFTVSENGNSGLGSSLTIGGQGGAAKAFTSSGMTVSSAKAGNGGSLGQPGSSPASGGGAAVGGTAGAAINKNGNTVTITNNGTIAGNINA